MSFAKESAARQTHPIYRPIRHEDPLEFEQIRTDLLTSWSPATMVERQLVEIAASAYVRIQRAEAFETSLFDAAMGGIQAKYGKKVEISHNDNLGCAVALGNGENDRAWQNIDRYRRASHCDYHRALDQLRKVQNDRRNGPVRELRAQREQDAYLRRTTAGPVAVPAASAVDPHAGDTREGGNTRREPIPFPAPRSGPATPHPGSQIATEFDSQVDSQARPPHLVTQPGTKSGTRPPPIPFRRRRAS